MKKLILAINFVLFIICSSCELFNDPVSEPLEVWNFCKIDSDGTNYKVLAELERHNARYFVNSGSQILIVHNYVVGSDEFRLIDIDGSNIQIIKPGLNIGSSAISPDHSKLAFVGGDNSGSNIYIMNCDGSNLQNITNSNITSVSSLSFSNDGKYIVFTKCSSKIQYIDILTGNIYTVLTYYYISNSSQITYRYPKFGKDDSIVFYLLEYRNTDDNSLVTALCSADIDEHNVKIIENDVAKYWKFVVSPTSEQIAFGSSDNIIHLNITDYNGLYKHDFGEMARTIFIDISADGANLVYGDEDTYDNNDISIINMNDLTRTLIAEGSAPVISADGLKVCFIRKDIIE
jgi:tricorn protease-like protein